MISVRYFIFAMFLPSFNIRDRTRFQLSLIINNACNNCKLQDASLFRVAGFFPSCNYGSFPSTAIAKNLYRLPFSCL